MRKNKPQLDKQLLLRKHALTSTWFFYDVCDLESQKNTEKVIKMRFTNVSIMFLNLEKKSLIIARFSISPDQ